MDKIVVATPLRNGVCSKPHVFFGSVEIRKIKPILWELSVARGLLSDDEREYLDASEYWLSVSKEVESWVDDESHNDLYDRARHAMFALQIICPKGGRNVYMKFNKTHQGFDNIGSLHPAKMESTMMGRMADLSEQGLEIDFDKVFRGVNRAFDENIVRLQNPIALLEHGLQTGHVYLSTLMWVMALDILFMAGEKNPFVDRVKGFLGAETPIFPSVPYPDRQPALRVADIVQDIYELRNVIAHGREIPEKPFRETRDIVDTNGLAINPIEYRYAEVIMEASLFLLVKSLLKIMTDGLIDLVKDEANWKQKLKIGARLEQQRGSTTTALRE